MVPLTAGRRWLHGVIWLRSKNPSANGLFSGWALPQKKSLRMWRKAKTLFLQTLVHQCTWSQHVALRVQQLGQILWHRMARSHVGNTGTDGHHLGDLLLHLPNLPVLLQHFICKTNTHRGNERVLINTWLLNTRNLRRLLLHNREAKRIPVYAALLVQRPNNASWL